MDLDGSLDVPKSHLAFLVEHVQYPFVLALVRSQGASNAGSAGAAPLCKKDIVLGPAGQLS